MVAFLIVSCSKDDGDNKAGNASNTIEYNGKAATISQAFIEDFGADEDDGYYNYDFNLIAGVGVSYHFYAELYSKGTNSFTPGTFEFFEGDSSHPDFYYSTSDIQIHESEGLDIVSGNIVVSGSSKNYSIKGTLTLENNEVLKIDYSGEFTIINEK